MLCIRNKDVIQSYLAILEQKLYLIIPSNSKMRDREPQSTCRSLHVQIPHMFVQLSSCILSHRIIFSNTLPRILLCTPLKQVHLAQDSVILYTTYKLNFWFAVLFFTSMLNIVFHHLRHKNNYDTRKRIRMFIYN